MNFEFATANRIVFGPGTLRETVTEFHAFGQRAFVVSGSCGIRFDSLRDWLSQQRILTENFAVTEEPCTDLVSEAARNAREFEAEFVIAIGGGSVIDTGKAVAALLANREQLFDYLEVIGEGKPLGEAPAPCIAIPTTAGTGAEVTKNAVIRCHEKQVKVSLRSSRMLPDLAIVDPELTYSMPREITASTGLDAFTQLLEAFVSQRANPLTDGICREGLKRTAASLKRAFRDGDDKSAREDMALASLFSGLALANAKLGAVHGLAGPLGGMFSVPHGMVCARLLPFVVRTNVEALQRRSPSCSALKKYNELATMLTGNLGAKPEDAARWISELCLELKVPSLSAFGLSSQHFTDVIEKSRMSSSMKGNPIMLNDEELESILADAV